MPSVEPVSVSSCDEELTSIGVLSSVCHGQAERFMRKFEVFVVKFTSIDGYSSGSITTCEVSSLDHKVRNDSVEFAAFEGESEIILNDISFAERNKVFDSLWNFIAEHINFNLTCISASDINCEMDFVSGSQLQ